jgi:hypothetical protein
MHVFAGVNDTGNACIAGVVDTRLFKTVKVSLTGVVDTSEAPK